MLFCIKIYKKLALAFLLLIGVHMGQCDAYYFRSAGSGDGAALLCLLSLGACAAATTFTVTATLAAMKIHAARHAKMFNTGKTASGDAVVITDPTECAKIKKRQLTKWGTVLGLSIPAATLSAICAVFGLGLSGVALIFC